MKYLQLIIACCLILIGFIVLPVILLNQTNAIVAWTYMLMTFTGFYGLERIYYYWINKND